MTSSISSHLYANFPCSAISASSTFPLSGSRKASECISYHFPQLSHALPSPYWVQSFESESHCCRAEAVYNINWLRCLDVKCSLCQVMHVSNIDVHGSTNSASQRGDSERRIEWWLCNSSRPVALVVASQLDDDAVLDAI